ncbi:MAG: hypothetical protein HOP30_22100 [Cyclobacteriaceae bacterium]|nr:hypothetical protein [Cyclobacteriaceae bacterium]
MNKIGLIIFIGLLSCKPSTDYNNTTGQADTASLQTKESVQTPIQKEQESDFRPIKPLDYGRVQIELTDTSQFHLVTAECALTIMPDTTWLREYRESMPEESWNEIISDNQYYESLAIDTLTLKGIKVFYGLNYDKRYIKFLKSNNSYFTIDKTKMKDSWGIVLFNGHDDPMIWSATFIGPAIRNIYKK